MEWKQFLVEIRDQVARITINRPPVNTLSRDALIELGSILDQLEKDPSVRSLILTGAGEKTFSAGADVSEFGGMGDREQAEGFLKQIHDLFNRIENFPKPVIAAINGKALGGGNELQMACHLGIAADHAELGLPEVRLGIMPGYGGTQRLPRLIGQRRALEIMLEGKRISAQEALEIGLVNKVVPAEQLAEEAFEWAKQLAEGPPVAMKGIIQSVINGSRKELPEGLKVERENMLAVMRTEDAIEGVAAFFSKRKPSFKGK
jgi:enoyl-CoA hydratase